MEIFSLNMAIKKLTIEIQSLLNAAAKLNNYRKAIEELVYNSLDADASSIAIRIHIHEHFIQVIDNGSGIARGDIPLLGQRYTSSKISNVSTFKVAPNKFGFRGESLSNIIEVSQSVKITTRYEKTKETWVKCFDKGQHSESYSTTMRPSKGTTIEVRGFLYNLHIQEKATDALNELQNIKSFLHQLSLVSTKVSISFRDNSKNEIIFKMHKNRDVYQTLTSLFDINKNDIQELQVEKNQYKAKGYIGKKDAHPNSYQWIYLNGKFVYKSALHDIINANIVHILLRNKKKVSTRVTTSNKYYVKLQNFSNDLEKELLNIANENIPFYFIFISCPYYDYDISFRLKETLIEFKDWHQIKHLLEKIVKFYNGDLVLKEIEMKQNVKLNKTDNTREEVRKIMERILGNNSNKLISPKNKVVKGKITRKRLKNKIVGDDTRLKNSHRKSNEHNKIEPDSLIVSKRKSSEVLDSTYKSNDIRVTKRQREESCKNYSRNNMQHGIQNLSLKKSKLKTKSKLIHCIDPLIEKFNEETYSVKNRCKLYSANLKEVLSKKIKPMHDNKYSNVRNGKKKVLKCKCKNDFDPHDYGQFSVTVHQNNSTMPLNKVNKEYLKSYDLVKTILSSQKECNYYVGKESWNVQKNTNKFSPFIDKYYKSKKYLKFVNKAASNCSTIQNITSFPKLTFQSHNYDKDDIVSLKRIMLDYNDLVSKQSKDNFMLRNDIMQSINVASKFKYDNRITKRSKSSFNFHSNDANKMDNNCKIHRYSECTDINNAKQNLKTINKGSFINFFQNNAHVDGRNYKITGNIQSTYTVIDSNISFNIESYLNKRNETGSNYQESVFSYQQDISNSLHPSNGEENDMELFSPSGKNNENNKVIFISKSQKSEKTSNISIQPLNVCATMYNHPITNDNKISDNCGQHIHDIFNDSSTDLHNISRAANNIDGNMSYINKEVEEISRHFQYIVNNENLLSNFCNTSLFVEEQDNNEEKKINNAKNQDNQNKNGSIESLDAYIENVQDCAANVYQNNDFKLQNRHSFLPKGMSPILENCQSKNICSYSLEMDYFQDDLYHNFANNILVNTKTFEDRIQHINANSITNFAQLNSRLKRESCLKFNAQLLENAKIFGQVDNKFIAAKLNSDTINKFKYLVLFDQHAVHERIRLEKNLSDYKNDNQWSSINCEKLSLRLTRDDVLYINNFKDKFTLLGLDWIHYNDCEVKINAIPKAIFGKHCRQTDIIKRSVKNLILEEIKAIKLFSGSTLLYPKSIMDLVFSEACRYAIKFGDKLSKKECEILINSLSRCKTPFQCAHGRPVMALLSDLKTVVNEYKVDLSKISIFRNKWMK